MHSKNVLIVAFEEFDNLGVRYLASVLSEKGYKTEIIDIRERKTKILESIRSNDPVVIGFSVIFQYYIEKYRQLVRYLRKSDIKTHFTAGGQYASLKSSDLFRIIPELDSIVRFDGEYTFLELVEAVYSGSEWKEIKGVAYRNDSGIVLNPLRPPILDLDRLPYPVRPHLPEYALGKRFATLIAGRGCKNNCSFCNNPTYIRHSSLPIRRVRMPEKVVEEIEFLHRKKKCSVFLFDDDDFPVHSGKDSEWITVFCNELKRKGLEQKIIWKINCRPDEIKEDIFLMMKNHGLFRVFVGIDDGTDEGLARLNKKLTAVQNLEGISVLKKLNVSFDYGFLLFQPSSTFGSVKKNIDFLEIICSDGSAPFKFLKIKPYFGTRIESELRNEGRLKGKAGFWDYDFLDPSLDHFHSYIQNLFGEWLTDQEGLANVSFWAQNYISVFTRFYGSAKKIEPFCSDIRSAVARSNHFITCTLRETAEIFESGKYRTEGFKGLNSFTKIVSDKHDNFKREIVNAVKSVCHQAEINLLTKLTDF